MTVPDVYPVTLPVGHPVLRDLTPVHIPNRNPLHPPLYSYDKPHPHHRIRPEKGVTYVYLVDPSPEGKEIACAIEDKMEVPAGPISVVGELQLQPGDAIFGRSILANGDPEEDAMSALGGVMITSGCPKLFDAFMSMGYSPADVAALIKEVEDVREAMLGTCEERIANRGHARFEMHPRSESLKNAKRCYGLNNMVQKTRKVESTPQALKTYNDERDSHQILINRFCCCTTKLNAIAYNAQAPADLVASIAAYSDQVNTPRMGCEDNKLWGPLQLNCAHPQRANSNGYLDSEMGGFGGPHKDKCDFCAGHTCCLNLSDLRTSAGCEPGRLHLLGLGVWWNLDYMSQFFFSGLLRHGGTSPMVPATEELSGWEIRLNSISYPATMSFTGEARHPLCSEPHAKDNLPSYVTAEMTGAFCPPDPDPEKMWTNHAHWAGDGWVGTGQLPWLNWMARALLLKSHHALAQGPADYGIEIDADKFLSAFSLIIDGERVDADPWPEGPDSDVRKPFSERHKAAQQGLMVKQFNRYMQCIPEVKVNKYADWDVTKRDFGSRQNPKATTASKRKRPVDDIDGDRAVSTKRPRPGEMLISHLQAQAARDLPMTSQELDYLAAFAAGPSSSTRSQVAARSSISPASPRRVNDFQTFGAGPSSRTRSHTTTRSTRSFVFPSALQSAASPCSMQEDTSPSSATRDSPQPSPSPDLVVTTSSSHDVAPSSLGITSHHPVPRHFTTTHQSRPTTSEQNSAVPDTAEQHLRLDLEDLHHSESLQAGASQLVDLMRSLSPLTSLPDDGEENASMPPTSHPSSSLPSHDLVPSTLSRSSPRMEAAGSGSLLSEADLDIVPTSLRKLKRTHEARRENLLDTVFTSALDAAFRALSLYNVEAQTNTSLLHALSTMDSINTKYKGQRLNCTNMEDIFSYTSSIHELKAYCHGTTLWINFYRHRVMLSDYRVSDAIQYLLDNRFVEVLALDEAALDENDWFGRLVFHVRSAVRLRTYLRADPRCFLPPGPFELEMFREEEADYHGRMRLPETQVDSVTLSYVGRLLHLWIGSDSSFLSQARAALVRLLLEHLGTGCLLLPEVWELYIHPPNWLFSSSCPRFSDAAATDPAFSPTYLEAFDAQLLDVCVLRSTTLPRFDKLQTLYLHMDATTRAHGKDQLAAQMKAAEIKKSLDSLTAEVQQRRVARQEQAKAKAAAAAKRKADKALLLANTPQASTTDLHLHSTPATSSSTSLLHPPASEVDPSSRVVAFLRDAYYAATHTEVSSMTKAQKLIHKQSDHFQPIRELACSRTIMRNHLTLDFAKRLEGFFSLQLFRCILFNSGAFRDCPDNLRNVEFNNVEEFEGYIDALKLKFKEEENNPTYFCNSGAHGTTTALRTLDRYHNLWDTSQCSNFVWPPDRNFATTYSFFKTYDPTKDVETIVNGKKKTEKVHLWKGVGKLTRYMLVLDMHGAGLVDPPTLDDVATVAAAFRLGAVTGLILLGYLHKDGRGEDAKQAFCDFYNDVRDSLSEEEIVNFQWNPMTAEHSLCKFSRMIGKKHYLPQ